MEKIKVQLKDGTVKEVNKGTSIYDIAKEISEGLARVAIGAEVNDRLVDLSYTVEENCSLNILRFEDEEGKDFLRHTSAHIMAQAVKRLYPDTKLAIGPAIDNGFYYDFDSEHKFTPEDLEKIEAEMQKIVKEKLALERFELPKDEAIKLMREQNESYKIELIEDLPEGEVISFYKQGEFVDLCAGPHAMSTDKMKAFKLLSIAGAYWRGDEKNKMLQRIYGTSFEKKKDLEEYLHRLEEAKKRDHRKIGKELDLFSLQEEGPGFPFFHPKGMVLRNQLEQFWRTEHVKRNYEEIRTPIILNEDLWHKSGHWDHYKENMYFTNIDEQDYAVKPMNCPGSILMYKRKMHSYRDLPIRMGELGLVHRHELSGALHGLMRVRCFTQDDAHIFMLPEQIKDEIIGVIEFVDYFYNIFGFKYHIELSTRPKDSMGTDEEWNLAINALKVALEEKGLKYKINEGDGAFYGPKIDFHLEDCIGRTWQCGTIQLDFQMPQRFDIHYIGADGEKHRPIMIHRVIFGSIERFIGILIEHYAGKFPTWLAPIQIKILPITDVHHDYVVKIRDKMLEKGLRVEVDMRNEKIGYKIREAQLSRVPYMLVVGDKEVEAEAVAVRSRDKGELGAVEVDTFIENIINDIEKKTI
ncbi:threonyl-tRNA synthetase [Natronincola peptidivorans]|uniref:Threonine--tRNA ligase n=1 Tax=Natronincola peptidivorans TaxID=426128 RepID=A0A1I0EVF9_9FIRM|nr:threonine--tRNA ligase [Natronincola peptidivorans]SET49618.1 threonyl-tRNA synthetase [Natronincola peptidivorans]